MAGSARHRAWHRDTSGLRSRDRRGVHAHLGIEEGAIGGSRLPARGKMARRVSNSEPRAADSVRLKTVRYTHGMTATSPRPGRNEPCHCGSGRKYKQCCLEKDEKAASAARAKAAAAAEAPAEPEADAASAKPKRPPKPETHQPWRTSTNRGFVQRSRTPRKVGGS